MNKTLKRSLKILVTAGPTREMIDKVRFISNPSTGKMGYEIAKLAHKRGHRTVLISGPTNILQPKGVKFIQINSACDMQGQVKKYLKKSDCLVMTAAVADFRPKEVKKNKIKKNRLGKNYILKLVKNPDILIDAGRNKNKKVLVGFALETENLIKNAREKLKNKKLDFIVAQQLTKKTIPFGEKKVKAVIINSSGEVTRLPYLPKAEIAGRLLKCIEAVMAGWPRS